MATPFKHPVSGFYYVRIAIPEDVRPAFGGKALYQKSLRTKVYDEAILPFEREKLAVRERIVAARKALAEADQRRFIDGEQALALAREFLDGVEGSTTRGAGLLRRVEADAFMTGLTLPPPEGYQPGDLLKALNDAERVGWRQLLAPVVEALRVHHLLPAKLPDASVDALEEALAHLLPA